MKLLSALPSLVQAMGVSPLGTKEVKHQPYSTTWKSQDTTKASGNAGKDMPAWKTFGGRGRSRGRGCGDPSNRGSRGSKDVNQYK